MKIPRISIDASKRDSFRIASVNLYLSQCPEEFNGYRMVQLSDMHYGPVTSAQHIKRAVEVTNELKPDLLLFTGDYIQYGTCGIRHILATKVNPKVFRWGEYRRKVRALVEELRLVLAPLKPPDGIIGVFGNHDYSEGVGTIRRKLGKHIHWLENAGTYIEKGSARLLIAGVADYRYGKPDLTRTLDLSAMESAAHDTVLKVLLSHNPDIVTLPDAQALSSADLIITGHTHGGQICLPLHGPIITRTHQRKHTSGLTYFQKTPVYTNHGVGYGGLPIRVFCPPEITIYTLKGPSTNSHQ